MVVRIDYGILADFVIQYVFFCDINAHVTPAGNIEKHFPAIIHSGHNADFFAAYASLGRNSVVARLSWHSTQVFERRNFKTS